MDQQSDWQSSRQVETRTGVQAQGWKVAVSVRPSTRAGLCGSQPGSQWRRPPAAWVGGWARRRGGFGGGIRVKTPGSELGSPFFFPWWVPAVPATLWERAFGNIRNGVSLFSPSILLTEFQSPSRLPASPDPSFVPALPRWRLW